MPCDAVTNAFIMETGRIGPELFRKSAAMRPIVGLIGGRRGTYPLGIGSTISVTTWERSLSTSTENPWTTVAPSDGISNACLPTPVIVGFGQTLRTYSPEQFALETEDFCIKDIGFDWQFAKVMAAVVTTLTQRTSWEWARKFVYDYIRLAGHHLTLRREGLGSVVDNGASGYSVSSPPTAALDFGTLEDVYMQIVRQGGSVRGRSEDTGSAVLDIIMSDEQYRMLLRNNPSLALNINYAYMGSKDDNPLLPGGMMSGRKRLFGQYAVWTDPYPRRFAIADGAYVEIPVWVSSSTTKGLKQTMNPAYEAAPYEEVIVYHPDNYQSLGYDTNAVGRAPGWKFDPVNSMGDWTFRNILNKECNPDGNIGFWRATLADAAEPVNPDVGYGILVLRCGYQHSLTSCYGGS